MLTFNVAVTGDKTVMANCKKFIGKFPDENRKGVKKLLQKAMDIAKEEHRKDGTVYSGELLSSYSFAVNKRGTKTVSGVLQNLAPYFETIETGILKGPCQGVWIDDIETLNAWRSHKGVPESNKPFVLKGESVNGFPYPKGVHSMDAAYKELLGLTEDEFQKRIKPLLF